MSDSPTATTPRDGQATNGRRWVAECALCFTSAIADTPEQARRMIEAHRQEDHR